MEFLKKLLIESLNGFSYRDIPLFFFQLLTTGLIAFVFYFIWKRKTGLKIDFAVLISMSVAVIVSLAKYSLPFSMLAAAILFIFLGSNQLKRLEKIALLILAAIGFGCGIGSVIQTALGITMVILILIFTPLEKADENKD